MKAVVLLIALFFISCGRVAENNVEFSTVPTHQEYSTFDIQKFSLALLDVDGHCVLRYQQRRVTPAVEKKLDLGIGSPCEVVRLASKDRQPQTYTYGEGLERRTVLLVTGGQPDPNVRDEFQPNGCGTELAKIRIFDDRVELAWAGNNGSPVCASSPVDEVIFAT